MRNPFIRRLICTVLVLTLFGAAALPAFAATQADIEQIKELIIRAYENHTEILDLTEYELHYEELEPIFTSLKNDNHLPWYADWYSYRYYTETGLVTELTLTCFSPEEYDYSLYERTVQEIMDETIFPGMSQWQIALSVHDYLAANYRYDETYTYYQSYDLLVGGTAVCNGYARAYMDILKRAGFDVIYATSDGMDHGWNLVKIGSEWYHVDVTWDDPISDCYGRVRHFYFLIDDKRISDEEHGHYGWEASQTADSDDMNTGVFWTDINSRICYESSAVSYLRMDDANEHWIYRRDEATGELTELAYFDAGYIDIGHGRYHYGNYGLSLWNGKLYFSDMQNVYVMDTDGSNRSVIYTYDAEANRRYINGSFVNDGTIYITLSDHEENQTDIQVPVPNVTWHEHDYTPQRTEPTCTENGFITYVCACGSSYQGETLEAVGHSYNNGAVTKEPTVDAAGEITYTCLTCGDSYTEVLPSLEDETPDATTGANSSPVPTLPRPTEEETRPVSREEEDDGNGFPIVPVIVAVLVVLFFLRPKKGNSGKRRGRSTSSRQSGDYGGGYDDDYSGGYEDSYEEEEVCYDESELFGYEEPTEYYGDDSYDYSDDSSDSYSDY